MISNEKNDTTELLKKLYAEKLANDETWQSIADRYNELTGSCKTANAIRKQVHRLNSKGIPHSRDIFDDLGDIASLDTENHLSPLAYDFVYDVVPAEKAEKINKSDERTEINAIYRRITREQTLKDIAKEAATKISEAKPFEFKEFEIPSKKHSPVNSGTLLISDWHYGMHIDSPFNKYNETIFQERLQKLLEGTIDYIYLYEINELNIFNLGDMIAGRIHNTIRIQNRIDVITQIMQVSEYIANFIFELSKHLDYIYYFDCLDNHSRLEPNLKDSLDLESLVRITHWYLKERFKDSETVVINENKFGDSIITTRSSGHNIIAVHGHNDSPAKVIEDLSLMTRNNYDLVCTAHYHHFQMDERNNCVFISNPSLMGTDEFAEKLRLSSSPSQVFIFHTPENVIAGVHRILV